jgi:hypothetical protein
MFSFEALHRRGTATLYILLSFSVSNGLCLSCRKQKIGIYGVTVLYSIDTFILMCVLIPLSDVTTVCPVFKVNTGDSVTLKGICCMIVNSERCINLLCDC